MPTAVPLWPGAGMPTPSTVPPTVVSLAQSTAGRAMPRKSQPVKLVKAPQKAVPPPNAHAKAVPLHASKAAAATPLKAVPQVPSKAAPQATPKAPSKAVPKALSKAIPQALPTTVAHTKQTVTHVEQAKALPQVPPKVVTQGPPHAPAMAALQAPVMSARFAPPMAGAWPPAGPYMALPPQSAGPYMMQQQQPHMSALQAAAQAQQMQTQMAMLMARGWTMQQARAYLQQVTAQQMAAWVKQAQSWQEYQRKYAAYAAEKERYDAFIQQQQQEQQRKKALEKFYPRVATKQTQPDALVQTQAAQLALREQALAASEKELKEKQEKIAAKEHNLQQRELAEKSWQAQHARESQQLEAATNRELQAAVATENEAAQLQVQEHAMQSKIAEQQQARAYLEAGERSFDEQEQGLQVLQGNLMREQQKIWMVQGSIAAQHMLEEQQQQKMAAPQAEQGYEQLQAQPQVQPPPQAQVQPQVQRTAHRRQLRTAMVQVASSEHSQQRSAPVTAVAPPAPSLTQEDDEQDAAVRTVSPTGDDEDSTALTSSQSGEQHENEDAASGVAGKDATAAFADNDDMD
eukprot:gnl/TRDRNA2_/TRDRNA2_135233_c0_seq1.p1 gnl/TRDRNA2_/TRDRNA2_135233_c0~~gnl/TRDRNA2_/TRDRNA2_135233_c0_seq1.p1  ORF type:complete len:643 (-),score=211.24 gnl/TRDRNA2_/TRDRNA2_135233_c0_seq1:299-2020(-)